MSTNSTPAFTHIRQDIIKYDCGDSLFKWSSLSEFYKPVEAKGCAVKYVAEGHERYFINEQTFDVRNGSYSLLKGEMDARVALQSRKNVMGICINIATKSYKRYYGKPPSSVKLK